MIPQLETLRRRHPGFTLVEMAITLAIIGFLAMGAMKLLQTLRSNSQLRDTRDQVSAIRQAVIGYAATNGRLPRFSTAADDFTPIVKEPTDLWGNNIVYIYDTGLGPSTVPSYNTICGSNKTSISITTCNDLACTTPASTTNNVAFLVFSRGPNYTNQTAASTAPVTSSPYGGGAPTTPGAIKTYIVGLQVGPYSAPTTGTQDYDDVVSFITLEELRQQAGCIGTQLRVLNNELPYGSLASPYTASLNADGGIPYASGGKYKWCYQGTVPAFLSVSGAIPAADCQTLAESSWTAQSDSVSLTWTAPQASGQGSYSLQFFVRDNSDPSGSQDNIVSKSFVLTINPQ